MTDISLLVPAYNEERHIRRCIDSICAQDVPADIEIVVVDDASTDDTADELRRLKAHRDCLRVIHHSANEGIVGTVQTLTERADGELYVRVDADSELLPGTLKAMWGAHQDGADLIWGPVHVSNTEWLHPAACSVGKERRDANRRGGACMAVPAARIAEVGGWRDGQYAAVQHLGRQAEALDWDVRTLDCGGVESAFPRSWAAWLERKYRSGRSHLASYDYCVKNVDLWALRGPAYWTMAGLLAVAGLAAGGGWFALAPLALPLMVHARYAPAVVAESGRWSHLIAYPVYRTLGGIARTVGVWTALPRLQVSREVSADV